MATHTLKGRRGLCGAKPAKGRKLRGATRPSCTRCQREKIKGYRVHKLKRRGERWTGRGWVKEKGLIPPLLWWTR